MKFGTLYSYWGNEWDCNLEAYIKLIQKVSSIGFDILEVSADHIYQMSETDLQTLNDVRKQNGLVFTLNSGPTKEFDLASADEYIRQQGIHYYTKIIEKMPLIESNMLIGALYSYWPSDFISINKKNAWERSINCLKQIGKVAESLNITIALEVLNRNETYILTNCEEAVEYCKKINSSAVKILLDTYHMNIEEDNIPDAIRYAGEWLAHLHVGENNRKLPGMNNTINWPAISQALHDIGYDKAVVMEPFLLKGGSVGNAIRVWRDLSNQASPSQMDEYISQSLFFLRNTFSNKN